MGGSYPFSRGSDHFNVFFKGVLSFSKALFRRSPICLKAFFRRILSFLRPFKGGPILFEAFFIGVLSV